MALGRFKVGPDCHVKVVISSVEYPFWIKPGTYQHQKPKLQSIEPTNNEGLSHIDYGSWKNIWTMTLVLPNSLETPAEGSFNKTGKQIRDDLWTCYNNSGDITFYDIDNTSYSAFIESMNEVVPQLYPDSDISEDGIEYTISIKLHEA